MAGDGDCGVFASMRSDIADHVVVHGQHMFAGGQQEEEISIGANGTGSERRDSDRRGARARC